MFLFILVVSFISAFGVSYPQPQNIELKPGQASFFTFQIQTDDFPVDCVPIIDDAGELELAFNQEYKVEANQRYNIKPQIIVPKETGFGNYKTTFCVECTPAGDISGSKVIPRVCNLPITVNVVAERTMTNLLEEPKAEFGWMLVMIVLAFAILILASIIYYLVRRRRAGL